MKKSILKTSNLILILGFCLLSYYSKSQDIKSNKQERKEARKIERSLNYRDLGILLEGRKFVLKLEQNMSDKNNQLNSQLNFLRVDSLNCVFQTEHKYFLLDRQVQGDIIKGKIDKWNLVNDNKHLSYHLQFKIVSWIGLFNVFMIIESDKTATGNIILKENTFSFYGHVAAF